MKKYLAILLTTGAVLALSAPLHAQRPAQRATPVMGLLSDVQRSLVTAEARGFSEAQVSQLESLRDELTQVAGDFAVDARARMQQMRERMEQARPSAEGGRGALRERLPELREAARERRAEVAAVLDPLRQRYEALVPPSQRPTQRAAAQGGRRGNDRAGMRPGRDRGQGGWGVRGQRGDRGQGVRGVRGQRGTRTPLRGGGPGRGPV